MEVSLHRPSECSMKRSRSVKQPIVINVSPMLTAADSALVLQGLGFWAEFSLYSVHTNLRTVNLKQHYTIPKPCTMLKS